MASSEGINNQNKMSMYYSLVKKNLQPHVHSRKNRNGTNGIKVDSTIVDSSCTRVLVILRLSGNIPERKNIGANMILWNVPGNTIARYHRIRNGCTSRS
jgi:hypothetical protein